MDVSLSPELEHFVRERVQSGRYLSTDEVVRKALLLLEQHEQWRAQEIAGFQLQIDERLAALDRGEAVEGEEFFATLTREAEARRGKQE